MNDYNLLPIRLLAHSSRSPIDIKVNRIPSIGECIHINQEDFQELRLVVGVTHLAWECEKPEIIAEIWTVNVHEQWLDKMAKEAYQNHPGRKRTFEQVHDISP